MSKEIELQPNIHINYLDLREFLYKFFELDLNPWSLALVVLQLGFIGWLIYQTYIRFKETQAERVLRGLIMISPLILVCYLLKLSIITKLIEIFSPTILIGLIVIFAPEFRRVLMQIGGEYSVLKLIGGANSNTNIEETCDEIVTALAEMSQNKVGALLIVEKSKVDRYYVNPGYNLNAKLTKALLLTIFSPKSPLHDGAVTVKGGTITSAAVILPMTENPKLDWQYGTRHRAAIGFSEITDSFCIVVSEETGDISIAHQGRLKRYTSIELARKDLREYYEAVYTKKKSSNWLTRTLVELFKLKR